MPAKLSETFKDEVEYLCSRDPHMTGVGIHRQMEKRHTGKAPLSLRMVQEIRKEFLATTSSGAFRPSKPWSPWVRTGVSSIDMAFLIHMDAVSHTVYRRNLTIDEAEWCRRLSGLLEGLCPFLQLEFCQEYSTRKRMSDIKGVPLYLGDLDGVLAYRPWITDNQEAYRDAVFNMLIPGPIFRAADFFDSTDVWDEVLVGIFTASIFETVRGMLDEPATAIWLRGNEELIGWAKEERYERTH